MKNGHEARHEPKYKTLLMQQGENQRMNHFLKHSVRPFWVVCLLGLLVLGACGKKGAPHAPGPEQDITYPRTYPAE